MNTYKGITFAKEHRDMPFADFKKLFASNRCFLEVPHEEREAELKKVHSRIKTKSASIYKSKTKSKKSNKTKS